MTTKKHKILYWLFKMLSVLVSCALPIWAICERFPVWTEEHGTTHSIGVGLVLIILVVAIIFRRTVFNFIRDKLNLKHAPPLAVWLVLLAISYIFVFLGEVMGDLTTVLWMGFIGCAIGTFLTYLSERLTAKEVNTND
ncbi:MAG: MFS transporter [Clostridia bacterium]|nr:MFS transporter [Clostridia bacterium]